MSDDGSKFQTKLLLGKVSFLKDGTEKAYIKLASDSASLQLATGSIFYITKSSGVPLLIIDQSSNMEFSTAGAYIKFASGRKFTDASSMIQCDGDFEITSGSKYYVGTDQGVGSDSFAVVTNVQMDGTDLEKKTVTITVKGGIITGRSDETDWQST